MRRLVIAVALLSVAAGPAPDDFALVDGLLRQHTAQAADQAVRRITALLADRPGAVSPQLRQHWLADLIADGHAAEAASLARQAITLRVADTAGIEDLLRLRVRALLAGGHPGEALAEAKSLFNVARMDQTGPAILLVAECLNATHAGDVHIVDQFRQDQSNGANTVLKAITVDASAYDEIRKQLYGTRYLIHSEEFSALMGQGNLLLLGDHAAEAETIFRQALASADEEQLLPAREGVARAIKAQDGGIARANAWIKGL